MMRLVSLARIVSLLKISRSTLLFKLQDLKFNMLTNLRVKRQFLNYSVKLSVTNSDSILQQQLQKYSHLLTKDDLTETCGKHNTCGENFGFGLDFLKWRVYSSHL
jgi:hypothetical protein